MTSPLLRYRQLLAEHGWEIDPAQQHALAVLDGIHHQLLGRPWRAGRLGRWLAPRRAQPVRGAYLWGGVGRGKTMLMDLFFQSLPFAEKRRSHFHRFMGFVHGELVALRERRDPLELVAERIAARTRVICFDELFVSDIADAMILGTLFEALFRRGVTLVATSNCAPDELYRDGLQRSRFLPAIELIKEHTSVIEVAGAVDYRLRLLARGSVYHSPADADAEAALARRFDEIAGEAERSDGSMEILGRPIPVRCMADGVAWFDFVALCDGPRSQQDYIEVARCFHTVLLSGVPAFSPENDNQARRFMALVDEFYDRRVKLVASAAVAPQALYQGERLAFEFRRTASRLEEMQSKAYLASAHIP